MMDWRDRIVSDPAILGGQACIKGTRIPVSVVLDNLAAGLSGDEIIANFALEPMSKEESKDVYQR